VHDDFSASRGDLDKKAEEAMEYLIQMEVSPDTVHEGRREFGRQFLCDVAELARKKEESDRIGNFGGYFAAIIRAGPDGLKKYRRPRDRKHNGQAFYNGQSDRKRDPSEEEERAAIRQNQAELKMREREAARKKRKHSGDRHHRH